MTLYFVCKLKLISRKPGKENLKKNKINIVAYSYDDIDAWEKLKEHAKLYMTRKNAKMCDQTAGLGRDSVKEMYVIREAKRSEDKVNTIEVYKQWKEKIKGYVVNSYKDREIKVAEFSIARYADAIGCGLCGKEHTTDTKPNVKAIATVIKSLDPRMLKELKECDLFKNRIKQVEKYGKRTNPLDDNNDDDESY